MSALAAGNLAAVVQELEYRLQPVMTPLEARTLAIRILVSRIGEADMLRWWASSIWSRAHALYQPIFRETWSKQRLLLILEAARAADDPKLRLPGSPPKSLFRLDPAFDARIEHKSRLLSPESYSGACNIVSSISVIPLQSLGSLGTLEPISDDEYPEVGRDLGAIIRNLAKIIG